MQIPNLVYKIPNLIYKPKTMPNFILDFCLPVCIQAIVFDYAFLHYAVFFQTVYQNYWASDIVHGTWRLSSQLLPEISFQAQEGFSYSWLWPYGGIITLKYGRAITESEFKNWLFFSDRAIISKDNISFSKAIVLKHRRQKLLDKAKQDYLLYTGTTVRDSASTTVRDSASTTVRDSASTTIRDSASTTVRDSTGKNDIWMLQFLDVGDDDQRLYVNCFPDISLFLHYLRYHLHFHITQNQIQ
jgi:hypothetical protein